MTTRITQQAIQEDAGQYPFHVVVRIERGFNSAALAQEFLNRVEAIALVSEPIEVDDGGGYEPTGRVNCD